MSRGTDHILVESLAFEVLFFLSIVQIFIEAGTEQTG